MSPRRDRALTSRGLWQAVLAVSLLYVAVSVMALTYGSSDFGGWQVVSGLVSGELTPSQHAIVWHARMPRILFAGIVGAALAVGGAVFQAVLRNPLADPYILGISGGAALGGTLLLALEAAVFGGAMTYLGQLSPPIAAFIGAMGTLSIIFGVARWTPAGRTGNYVLLLTGVIVNAFASAVILFLKSVVSARKAQEMLFYLMGTLTVEGLSFQLIASVGGVVLACLAAIIWYARDLNVLSLGDDEAAALGVDVERTRWWTVAIASLAVACAVAFTGLIGFVGLVVPHGLRLVVGPDHRVLIPCCALGGAAFLTGADLLTRASFAVFSTTLPVGVVTAFVGAPLFVVFLWRNLRQDAEGVR